MDFYTLNRDPIDKPPFGSRNFKQLVRRATRVFIRNFWQILSIAFVSQFLFALLVLLLGDPIILNEPVSDQIGDQNILSDARYTEIPVDLTEDDQVDLSPDEEQTSTAVSVNWNAAIALALAAWFGLLLSGTAITRVVLVAELGERLSFEQIIPRPLHKLMPLVATTLATYVIILVFFGAVLALSQLLPGYALPIGVVGGVYLGGRMMFAPIVSLLQGKGPTDALKTSFHLTGGENSLRACGYLLLIVVFNLAVGALLNYTVGRIPIAGDFIVGSLLIPPVMILVTLLYVDMRAKTSFPGSFQQGLIASELGLDPIDAGEDSDQLSIP